MDIQFKSLLEFAKAMTKQTIDIFKGNLSDLEGSDVQATFIDTVFSPRFCWGDIYKLIPNLETRSITRKDPVTGDELVLPFKDTLFQVPIGLLFKAAESLMQLQKSLDISEQGSLVELVKAVELHEEYKRQGTAVQKRSTAAEHDVSMHAAAIDVRYAASWEQKWKAAAKQHSNAIGALLNAAAACGDPCKDFEDMPDTSEVKLNERC